MDTTIPPEKWARLRVPGPNDINVPKWVCDTST
ncbi:hypothetical protein B0G80_1428 [Paraburkholderia sp. BL6669N2]|nr:hypothetical protein B0G80_1428 [Paraburkholderia sp. BL6669N2]